MQNRSVQYATPLSKLNQYWILYLSGKFSFYLCIHMNCIHRSRSHQVYKELALPVFELNVEDKIAWCRTILCRLLHICIDCNPAMFHLKRLKNDWNCWSKFALSTSIFTSFGVQTWFDSCTKFPSVVELPMGEASVDASRGFGGHPMSVQAANVPSALQTHVLQSFLKVSFGVHAESSEAFPRPWSTQWRSTKMYEWIKKIVLSPSKYFFVNSNVCYCVRGVKKG